MNDAEMETYIYGDYAFEILHTDDDIYEIIVREKNEFDE